MYKYERKSGGLKCKEDTKFVGLVDFDCIFQKFELKQKYDILHNYAELSGPRRGLLGLFVLSLDLSKRDTKFQK